MKKIALCVIHFVIFCWAATWCFKLATKQFPHSGSTVEQWRQQITQITNVAELHQKLIKDQEYILGSESLLERLRWIAVPLVAVLVVYSFVGIVRSLRKKRHDNAA